MASQSRCLLWASVLLLSGCDTLFPEFSGNGADAAVARDGGASDDGGAPMLAGVVCILGDVRDYRTCATGSPGLLRITVEETRQQAVTDATGHFVLPLAMKLDSATVAAVDPAGHFATSVIPVRLVNGAANNLALPVLDAQTLSSIELANGLQDDPQRGTFLGWAIDPTGTPVAGVSSAQTTALYDDNAPNSVSPGTTTHQRGTIMLFTVTPSTLTLQLTPPPTVALQGDSFTVPIRPGAVTTTTLVLPPK
ncbi:MAG: hypothetical protein ACXVDD_16270 [Polyangia bacterium]